MYYIKYMVYDIDLTKPKFAYLFGLLQTDGTLKSNTRNRGCLSVELKVEDSHIPPSSQYILLSIMLTLYTI
jgi:hypothetical protein